MAQGPSIAAPGADGGSDTGRTATGALAGLSVVVFLVVAAAGAHRTPGSGGLLQALISAAVVSGLFWFASSRGVRWLARPATNAELLKGGDLDATLGPTLRELETVRVDIAARINRRMRRWLPLGLAGGVAFWALLQFRAGPPGVVELLTCTATGGGVGYMIAAAKLSEQYRQAYKSRVLPLLAGRFGKLSYRKPEALDLKPLCAEHVLASYDDLTADDEIWGSYRNLPLSIVELKLTEGSGKEQRTVFDGLLTRLDLPRKLVGVTAIVGDTGLAGRLEDVFRSKGRQRVRLESPDFEARYDVFGSDQVAARALLTPAFMERLTTLGERAGFGKPTVLALDNRLTIALPKQGYDDLFEPPSYSQPAASLPAITKLTDDLAAVLRAADAVIDLDQFSSTVAASAPA